MQSPGTQVAIELLTRARTLLLSYVAQLESDREGSYYGAGRQCIADLEDAITQIGGPEYERRGTGIVMPTHDVLQ